MIRFFIRLVLAYAVEQILWGEAIKLQLMVNKAAARGKLFVMTDRVLRLGYPFKIRGRASIHRCTFIGEQQWRPRHRQFSIHIPREAMHRGWEQDLTKIWITLQGGSYTPPSEAHAARARESLEAQ